MPLPDLKTLQRIGRAATAMKRPLILSHTRPDCDAYGCLIALRSILRRLGADPLAAAFNPLPRTYEFLKRFEAIGVWGQEVTAPDLQRRDGVIIADTCTYNQLEPLADWLRTASVPIVVVDHHITRDVRADHVLLDESAAAACLIIYESAQALGWPIDDVAAEALFVGIATDTGWFVHSNTDARALSVAAALAARGVQPNAFHTMIYQSDAPARLLLSAEAVGGMELLAEGRLAVMTVPLATLKRLDARTSETENIINEPMRIRSVVVSILLIEQEDGPVRVSFRSKAPLAGYCELDIDVAALAATFNGGGHRRAAGARVEGTLPEVRERVVKEALRRLV